MRLGPDCLRKRAMDWDTPTVEEHEIEYLAHMHGTSLDQAREANWRSGNRSREAAEAALDMELPCLKRFLFGPV